MMTTKNDFDKLNPSNNGENGRSLPDGWEWTSFDNVIEKMSNGTTATQTKVKDGVPVTRIETISQAKINLDRVGYTQNPSLELINKYKLQIGDVLFSNINSDIHLGKTAIFELEGNTLLHGMNLLLLRPKTDVIIPRFLNYLCSHYRFSGHFISIAQHAVNQSSINQTKLKQTIIPLPPLSEQERIVNRIEELFSDLDAGVAALERVHVGLKRYKASVLKAACEGRLLPSGHGGAVPVPGELPEGWRWATLGELMKHLTSGSRGWAKYYAEEGSLFVRVGNFNRLSKTIELTKIIFVNAPDGAEANRTRLQARDLLITMTADVGMIGIVDENTLRWGNAYINQHVGLVRLNELDYVDYIAYALASEIGQKQFREKQYGATKTGLNFEDIKSLEIPLPPLEEQRRIVAEVERRLSVVGEVESAVEVGLVRAGRLRQSVLRSAFEGRL